MNILKTSALLLLIDALLFAFDTTIYSAYKHMGVEWERFFILVLPLTFLAWGLWKANRWAWVGSLILSLVFGVMQIASLMIARSFALSFDLMVMLLTKSILTTVFCFLLFPLAWKTVWANDRIKTAH